MNSKKYWALPDIDRMCYWANCTLKVPLALRGSRKCGVPDVFTWSLSLEVAVNSMQKVLRLEAAM